MDTLLTFLFSILVTVFLVRKYLKALPAVKHATLGGPAGAFERPAMACPRCGKPILRDSAFCAACGVHLAIWNVHRAAVKRVGDNAKGDAGKPRPVINASLCIGCGSCVDSCPETGTLALIGGKAILAHAERCVGHAECVQVCPTSAITLAVGDTLQTLRAPFVKEDFETNVPGIYIVGELSGMGLIKTAINEGKLAMDSIRRRIESKGEWQPRAFTDCRDDGRGSAAGGAADEPFDVLIVGAGPAGLSASLAALQDGLRYVTLEQGEVASTIRNYPRHKFLMAEPVAMPLYGNLYVGDGTKESLLKVWETILANTGVQVQTQQRVESIVREGPLFRVTTAKSVFRAKNVVLALGKRGSPRRANVPGEGLAKVTYGLIEADSYENKDILVVGGGDSAIEASLALSKAARNRVVLSYRGQSFDRAKERNRRALRDAEEQGRVRILRGSALTEILPDCVKLMAQGRVVELANDYVFVLIGGESPEAFLQKAGIEIVEKIIGAEAAYEAFA